MSQCHCGLGRNACVLRRLEEWRVDDIGTCILTHAATAAATTATATTIICIHLWVSSSAVGGLYGSSSSRC